MQKANVSLLFVFPPPPLSTHQIVPALQGWKTVRPGHERQRLGDQAEVRQPVLLQRVHPGRVRGASTALTAAKKRKIKEAARKKNLCHWEKEKKNLFSFSLKRTTDVMFGGKQVVVCGYGEVSCQAHTHSHWKVYLSIAPRGTCNTFKC